MAKTSDSPRLDDLIEARHANGLSGRVLYGDDFSSQEIAAWFEDEREGYFNLKYEPAQSEEGNTNAYGYEAIAHRHGFRWLPSGEVNHVLGVGSATGAELAPLAKISKALTVLEPSDGFKTDTVHGRPVSYVKPDASGVMPFPDACFDIVICFSVLHTSRTSVRSCAKWHGWSSPAVMYCCVNRPIPWETGATQGAGLPSASAVFPWMFSAP